MPCWRCGAREVDPVRGPSPWKRAVRAGAHVLVCPDCQLQPEWTGHLDHCRECGSWRLVRQLGTVSCRSCGMTADAAGQAGAEPAPTLPAAPAPVAPTTPSPTTPSPTTPSPSTTSPSTTSSERAKLAADVHAALERMWRRTGDGADR